MAIGRRDLEKYIYSDGSVKALLGKALCKLSGKGHRKRPREGGKFANEPA